MKQGVLIMLNWGWLLCRGQREKEPSLSITVMYEQGRKREVLFIYLHSWNSAQQQSKAGSTRAALPPRVSVWGLRICVDAGLAATRCPIMGQLESPPEWVFVAWLLRPAVEEGGQWKVDIPSRMLRGGCTTAVWGDWTPLESNWHYIKYTNSVLK